MKREAFVRRAPRGGKSGVQGAAAAAALSLVVPMACQGELAPYPGARLAVDTDLPVPRAVDRLRVDVFGDTGVWLETRDYPRLRPEDWPATFSVFAADEARGRTFTLRLRAYAEGAVRDYRGPRYAAPATFTPAAIPAKLDEVCAALPVLPPGQALTQRRGAAALTAKLDHCYQGRAATRTGTVGARIEIAEAGRYRFEVTRATPNLLGSIDTTLSLRRSCDSYESEIACADDIDYDRGNLLSRLVTELQPGTYTLLTGGTIPNQPADLTLQWDREDRFAALPEVPPAPPSEAAETAGPRLVRGGADITPSTEPLPTAAVDRLVQVTLTPGRSTELRVTLRGACAGTQAHLVFDADGHLRPEQSASCIDVAGALAPPTADPPRLDDHRASVAGTYLAGPCAAADSDDQVVCVPGGAFVMGDPSLAGVQPLPILDTAPSRVVGLTRFYLDRREVTVGRLRQARAEGLPRTLDPDGTDITDLVDLGFNESTDVRDSKDRAATYSAKPQGREAYPVEMISWAYARRVCQFYGGDLPSETQWEYAATAAGRAARSRFPWGESDPSCERLIAQRTASLLAPACAGAGPASVEDVAALGDVTPLGIEGMGGNVAELVRDAAARYDAPCWNAARGPNPECVDPDEPHRIARGGSWLTPLAFSRAAFRSLATPSALQRATGFRCMYPTPPVRRWSGP